MAKSESGATQPRLLRQFASSEECTHFPQIPSHKGIVALPTCLYMPGTQPRTCKERKTKGRGAAWGADFLGMRPGNKHETWWWRLSADKRPTKPPRDRLRCQQWEQRGRGPTGGDLRRPPIPAALAPAYLALIVRLWGELYAARPGRELVQRLQWKPRRWRQASAQHVPQSGRFTHGVLGAPVAGYINASPSPQLDVSGYSTSQLTCRARPCTRPPHPQPVGANALPRSVPSLNPHCHQMHTANAPERGTLLPTRTQPGTRPHVCGRRPPGFSIQGTWLHCRAVPACCHRPRLHALQTASVWLRPPPRPCPPAGGDAA